MFMNTGIMYIELKSGYGDNGPAWIGMVGYSKTKQTIYFNNKAFKKYNGISGNYYDVESGEEYRISGVKKNGMNRHWAGSGRISIDRKVIDEYLSIIGKEELDMKNFEIVEIEDLFPIERVKKLENRRVSDKV